jgi:hypothetical protein
MNRLPQRARVMVGKHLFRAGLAAVAGFGILASGAGISPAIADNVDAMTFTMVAGIDKCQGCILINAAGEITDDTSHDFAVFVAQNRLKGTLPKEVRKGEPTPANAPRVIVGFESIGGKVLPALVIGRRLRELGWTTIVGQAVNRENGLVFESAGCYSACSMVMLGGAERFVVPGSKAGVHQFSPQFGDDENFNATEMNEIVRDYGRQVVNFYDYVQDMGVNVDFFLSTMRTPFASMDVMTPARWTSTGLATGTLPGNDEATVADLMAAEKVPIASAKKPVIVEETEKHTEALAPISDALASGLWTVARPTTGPAAALFADASVRVSVACASKESMARIDLIFKDLDPIDLEHIRAAAFASRKIKFAERELAIANVPAAGRGEQGVAALIGVNELKGLPVGETLTFAVLDRSGKPAGRVGSFPVGGAAKAIDDAMARCGGA